MNCPTYILPDTPATDDSFGSHERVSQAIAELIRTDKQGLSIALTGEWGSGKSTVIQITSTKLAEAADFFIFDAWAHEGDPLRRVFLEAFVAFAQAKHFDTTGWQNQIDILSKRRNSEFSTVQPVMSPSTKCFVLTVALVPFLLALHSLLEKPIASTGLQLALLFLASVPVIAVLVMLLQALVSGLSSPYKKFDLDELLAILLSKTAPATQLHTLRSVEPTSIEFQSVFVEMANDFIKTRNRKLVVVIDNLDRIEPSTARSLWSTMKSFFDAGNNLRRSDGFWLVAAFDYSAISALWSEAAAGEAEVQSETTFAASFLDKTFQAVFRVPPLITSDWHDYMMRQLRTAFTLHNDDEFETICSIYGHKRFVKDPLITPREVKNFINRIGSVHRQWDTHENIGLVDQALFVILNRERVENFEQILLSSNSALQPIPKELVSDDWVEPVAAIYFNVPRKKALQVLIGGGLTQALMSGDTTGILKLSDTFGFARVAEDVVLRNQESWSQNPQVISNAALALSKVSKDTESGLRKVWSILCDASFKQLQWVPFDSKTGEGLSALLKRRPQVEFARSLLQSASNSISNFKVESIVGKNEYAEQAANFLAPLLRDISEFKFIGFDPIIQVRTDPETFLALYHTFLKRSGYRTLSFEVRTNIPQEAVRVLSEEVRTAKFSPDHFALLRGLIDGKQKFDWTQLISATQQVLGMNNNLQAGIQQAAILSLFMLGRTETLATDVLQTLTRQGNFFHFLVAGPGDDTTRSVALLPILVWQPNGTPPEPWQWRTHEGARFYRQIIESPQGHAALIRKTADLMEQFGFREMVSKNLDHPFFSKLRPILFDESAVSVRSGRG